VALVKFLCLNKGLHFNGRGSGGGISGPSPDLGLIPTPSKFFIVWITKAS